MRILDFLTSTKLLGTSEIGLLTDMKVYLSQRKSLELLTCMFPCGWKVLSNGYQILAYCEIRT